MGTKFGGIRRNIITRGILNWWRRMANGFGSIADDCKTCQQRVLQLGLDNGHSKKGNGHLSESLDLPWAFFLFGAGILHSMEKATQLVHGTPRLAASQRTYSRTFSVQCVRRLHWINRLRFSPSEHGKSIGEKLLISIDRGAEVLSTALTGQGK